MPVPRLSLESLRVFEACARHGNFTRAAKELSVTTTAVSQRIRNLEQRLGVGLFHRRGPRLSLTEAGRALGGGVREGLALMQRAVEDCVRAKPRLRVTCTPTFANRLLVPMLQDYHRLEGSDELVLDITTEERHEAGFDVAIRSGTGPWLSLEACALMPLEGTPMVSPELTALLDGEPASLSRVPLLRDDRWAAWFELAGAPLAARNLTAVELPAQDTDAVAAINGSGAALLSPRLFEAELRRGTLVAPFTHVLRGPGSYWLLWKADRPPPHFALWLRSVLAPETDKHQA